MKDGYFGDINDFNKYALLRALCLGGPLRLNVCWMLTDAHPGTDGQKLGYLEQPLRHRACDPKLFDWLHRVVHCEGDRRTARIEASRVLGCACFHSEILTDHAAQRLHYFATLQRTITKDDLLFFDPDNGLEVKSVRKGRRNSCKYLYWDEVADAASAGASLLIYQHFPRVERRSYTDALCARLRQVSRCATILWFRTPRVLFLLAVQPHHEEHLRSRIQAGEWKVSDLLVGESDLVTAGNGKGPESLPAPANFIFPG